MQLKVSGHERGGIVVTAICGECDIATAPELREQLLWLLERRSPRIVLDLSGLDFLDCAAARVLLATGRRASLLGGALAIAAPTPPVARVLRLTGLDRRLVVLPAVATAIAAVRPPAGAMGKATVRPFPLPSTPRRSLTARGGYPG